MSRASSPFGPLTVTRVPSKRTSTPRGRLIGTFPTRLISSPHVAKYFAAEAALAGILARHHALRRRDDSDSETAVDTRNLAAGGVDPQTRLADAVEAGDHRLALGGVSEVHADLGAHAFGHGLEVFDVAFRLQHVGDGELHLRGRHIGEVVTGNERVADASEHIGDWVSDRHGLPARLLYARQVAQQGVLAETDAAKGKLPDVRA